jgi:transposase
VHCHAGRSKNEVAGSLGLSRNTVRKYVAAAEAAGMAPGGPAVSQERWAELAREWFPELADTWLRQVTWPAIEEHRDYIVAQLAAGVTVATIHQRLAGERGLAASVASLRRYVAANLPEEARRSQVRVLRLDPPEPGQEAQVDYGRLGQVAGCRDRQAPHDLGVRDGAVLLAAPVRPPGHHDGPACLDRVPRGGV